MVSSEQPWKSFNKSLNLVGAEGILFFKILNKALSSAVAYDSGLGNSLFYSYLISHFFPSKIIMEASPPSSTKMLGP